MTVPAPPSDPHGRHAYALETCRLADRLWDSVYVPWRWPRWRREHRVIVERNRLLRESLR